MGHCVICGEKLPEKALFVLENAPASAQDIPDEKEVKDDRGIRLPLCQCGRCGLVQFDCAPVSYYRDVIRSGGTSTTMAALRNDQYRHLIERYRLEGKKFLEVGCGQGEFLNMLAPFPVKAYGVEHRQALVDLGRKNGLNVARGFTEDAHTVLGHEGPYDVFLSFNFLEHQPRPGVMLDCIRNNLTEGGMGLITVPSLEYILQCDRYYELIRDHIAYYSFSTLRNLLERHGFAVLEEEMVNEDTLSVIVRKMESVSRAEGGPPSREVPCMEEDSPSREVPRAEGALPSGDISRLEASLISLRRQMEDLFARREGQGKRLAVWGASHQGFTLAATTCLGEKACYMIDSALFKQGRFAPASHLPIVSPDHFLTHPVEGILIVAPGYVKEIAGVIRGRFGHDVEILTIRSDRLEEEKG